MRPRPATTHEERSPIPSRATVVVEYESAAGLTNLMKYWPLLRSEQRPAKRFVIVHVFQVTSPGDYLSHRLLWDFMVERMTADLLAHGLQWSLHWEARSFTYRRGETAATRSTSFEPTF